MICKKEINIAVLCITFFLSGCNSFYHDLDLNEKENDYLNILKQHESSYDYYGFYNALNKKNDELIDIFLSLRANGNNLEFNGPPLLSMAIMADRLEVVKELLENGASVNEKWEGHLPLYWALGEVEQGNLEIVKLLIKNGADVNETGIGSSVGKACMNPPENALKLLRYLLECGADPNFKRECPPVLATIGTMTADNESFRSEYKEIFKLLRESNANFSAKSRNWETGIFYVERYYALKMLLELGFDINAKDFDGDTPIMKLCFYDNNASQLRMYIENGTDINNTNYDGETVLHRAVYRGHYDTAFLLIAAGADLFAINNDGETVLDYLNEAYRRIHFSTSDIRSSMEDSNLVKELKQKVKKKNFTEALYIINQNVDKLLKDKRDLSDLIEPLLIGMKLKQLKQLLENAKDGHPNRSEYEDIKKIARLANKDENKKVAIEEGRHDAKEDVANGKYQLRILGYPDMSYISKAESIIDVKYITEGCIVTDYMSAYCSGYNSYTRTKLKEKYGPDIFDRIEEDINPSCKKADNADKTIQADHKEKNVTIDQSKLEELKRYETQKKLEKIKMLKELEKQDELADQKILEVLDDL